MRRRLLTAFALLVTACSIDAQETIKPPAGKTLTEMIQQVRDCIVRIEVNFPDGVRSVGTGFFVNTDGLVLTARHVIYPVGEAHPPDRIRAEVRIPTFQYGKAAIAASWVDFPSSVVATDNAHDLALLKPTQGTPFPEIGMIRTPTQHVTVKPLVGKLASQILRDGEPIFTSGYPLDLPILITTSGFIASSDPMTYDFAAQSLLDIYWADMQVNPGNSGGPLFSLESGKVIGMVLMFLNTQVVFADNTPGQANGIAKITDPLVLHPLAANSGLSIILSSKHLVDFLKSITPPIRYEVDERK
jgi:S1-C subfamily serine protease